MGKKSRRNKAPKAARERRDEPEEEPEFAEDRLIRYREPEEYNIDKGAAQFLAHEHFKAIGGENDGFEWGEGELETMSEFMYLVVFPAHKQLGFEAALRVSRRWPRFKPHWHRVRRRAYVIIAGSGTTSRSRACGFVPDAAWRATATRIAKKTIFRITRNPAKS